MMTLIKTLILVVLSTMLLIVIALTHCSDLDDFEQALEDEEQMRYLEEWRMKHGKG